MYWNIMIRLIEKELNDSYNSNLVIGGIYGPKTTYQVKEQGHYLNVDGYYENITKSKV